MATRTKKYEPPTLTVHQVVAYNFRRARELRHWTQEQTSQALEPYLGYTLRQAGVSAIEKTYDSPRRRNIDVAEVTAFAQGFMLPITWFFLPPVDHATDLLAPVTAEHDPPMVAELVALYLGTPNGHELAAQRLAELHDTDHDALWHALRSVYDGHAPTDWQEQIHIRRRALRDATLAQYADARDNVITQMASLLVELVKLTPTGWAYLLDTDPQAAIERIAEGDKLVQRFVGDGPDDVSPMDIDELRKLVAVLEPASDEDSPA